MAIDTCRHFQHPGLSLIPAPFNSSDFYGEGKEIISYRIIIQFILELLVNYR